MFWTCSRICSISTLSSTEMRVISLATDKWMGLLLWWKPFHPADVETITKLIAAGAVRPIIDRTFPLSEVADALRYVDAGHARGKVIITMPASAPPGAA